MTVEMRLWPERYDTRMSTATEVAMRMHELMSIYTPAQQAKIRAIAAHHTRAMLGYPVPSVPAMELNIDDLLMPEPALEKQELPPMDKLEFGL